MSASVVCTQCQSPLPLALLHTTAFAACPVCATPLFTRLFPALLRRAPEIVTSEHITDAGQAACFYHLQKTAHVPCDACGRFICALCDVELQGQHLCPSCVESGRRKGALTTLESRRVLWDNIALSAAVLPVISVVFWWASIVTAPVAIFLTAFGWRKPGSLAPRTKIRFIIALVFSLLVLGGWGVLFYFLATKGKMFE